MKKRLKKLGLHRETLHRLSRQALSQAIGGTDGILYTGCGSECSACGRVCQAPVEEIEQPVMTC
jgi:hypothetical protein